WTESQGDGDGPECGGNFELDSGVITSQLWPRSYPPNTTCDFFIETITGKVLALEFSQLRLDPGADESSCLQAGDRLIVRDGMDETAAILGEFCGHVSLPKTIRSIGNQLWLHFVSDADGSDVGFHATYISARQGHTFVISLTEDSIPTFTSPNWPLMYPGEEDARWEIEAPLGKTIELSWMTFDLEGLVSHKCPGDYVLVEAGRGQIHRFCSRSPPPTISSFGNTLNVTFHSDGTLHRRGFRARVQFRQKVQPTPTTTTPTTTTATTGADASGNERTSVGQPPTTKKTIPASTIATTPEGNDMMTGRRWKYRPDF
uniref:CUB domain-containing protein n=1 Tax=Eptatretus burgeri TaxID=7764 RepID=A0A8C4PZR1_EPTBU